MCSPCGPPPTSRSPSSLAGAAAAPAAANAVPVRETTNHTPVPELRLFVVMLDDLSITPSRGKGMFFAAGRFVDALPLSDVVGFTTTSGSASLNPTRNRQAVDAALRHTAGEFIDPRATAGPPVGIQEALEIRLGNNAALQQAIQRDCGLKASLNKGDTVLARRRAQSESALARVSRQECRPAAISRLSSTSSTP